MHVLLKLSRTIISNLLMEECVKFALGDTFVGRCLYWFIDSDHNRLICKPRQPPLPMTLVTPLQLFV